MDDSRSKVPVILGGIALALGVVALVLAISAKNGNQSDQEIADSVKTELANQQGATAALAGKTTKAQKAEAGSTAALSRRVASLAAEVAKLRTQVDDVSAEQSKQSGQIQSLESIPAEITNIDKRLDKLEAKTSG